MLSCVAWSPPIASTDITHRARLFCKDAAMALKSKHLADGEQVIHTMRTHVKHVLWPIVLLVLLVVGVAATWFFTRDMEGGPWILLVVGVLALIIAVVWSIIPIWKWRASFYAVTNRRILWREGILTKTGRDIPLYRINDITYERDVLDRMLGCGTLIVSDATEKAGMKLDDVPNVEKVKVQIQNLLYQQDDLSDDGEFPPADPRTQRRRQGGRPGPEGHGLR